jgi:hypothetical protein
LAAKGFTVLLSVLTIGAALSLAPSRALAGDDKDKNVTEDQIVRALAPPKKPLTRGLSVGPQSDPAPSAEETKLLQSVRGRTTRSLSSTEREEIATAAKTKPAIDLEITFDYNSADISAKSMPSVQALGRALTSSDLKGSMPPAAKPTTRTSRNAAPIRSSAIWSTSTAFLPPTSSPSATARAS